MKPTIYQIARTAGLRASTVYAHQQGRYVGAFARARITEAEGQFDWRDEGPPSTDVRTRNLTSKDIERIVDDTAVQAKALASAPTWSDIRESFPDAVIVDHPDGTRSARINDLTPDKRRLRLLNEMFRKKNQIEANLGQTKHARDKEVVMKDERGVIRHVKERDEERVAKKLKARRIRRQKHG